MADDRRDDGDVDSTFKVSMIIRHNRGLAVTLPI